MSNQIKDPVKAKKVLDLIISILTIVGSFLIGQGANACVQWYNNGPQLPMMF